MDQSLRLFLFAFVFIHIVAFHPAVLVEVDDGLEPVFELLGIPETKGEVYFAGQKGFFLFLIYFDLAHMVLVTLHLETVDFIARLLETLGNGDLGYLNEFDLFVEFCFEFINIECQFVSV